MHLLLLNGPNLNLLGQREPGIYGSGTLASIEDGLRQEATAAGAVLECFQSNFEGALVERIHQAIGASQGIPDQCRRIHPHLHCAEGCSAGGSDSLRGAAPQQHPCPGAVSTSLLPG